MRVGLITGIFPPDIGGPATFISALSTGLRALRRAGHHQGHGGTLHLDRLSDRCQDGLVAAVVPQAILTGDVRRGDDRHHPFEPPGFLRIERQQARVVMGAAHDPRVQRPGHPDVLNEPGPPGHLIDRIDPNGVAADDGPILDLRPLLSARR